jgi:pimeloyl-ACP methyl ester carboxylesterase
MSGIARIVARNAAVAIAVAGLIVIGLARVLAAQSPPAKPSIVLVHGAFADASGWSKVIAILQRDGYNVIAVQNPLTSLATDVETTKRVVVAQPGPVVLVGHSYGGAVITAAAAGSPNVKALVFIAAFVPDSGEPIGAFGEKYPAPLGTALKPDAAGFLYVDTAKFHDVFAADLPVSEARIAAATQKPIIGSVFGASVDQATWKTIPSWYLVSQDDRAINPDLERFYAKRAKAHTSEVKSSHVAFLSHPAVVAGVIEQAARAH